MKRKCYFCENKIDHVDYKEAEVLSQFLSAHSKIRPKRQSGLCSKHQRRTSRALKRARQMALLPYVNR
ncbi:30S ribosomal protein S18 [Patescibacteria group bacterium]